MRGFKVVNLHIKYNKKLGLNLEVKGNNILTLSTDYLLCIQSDLTKNIVNLPIKL